MAKTTASGTAQPWLAMLAKHHFWLLAVAVPLVLLPVLFLAQGTLTAQIEAVRGQIKGHITALQNVRRIPQHPNTSWTNDIDTSTMRVKRETLAEWRKFWDGQQSLRVWPESLGPDFIKAVESLKPDGKLSPRLLERYQNTVRTLVSELPARMGVPDAMGAQAEGGSPTGAQPQPALRPDSAPQFATWDAGNQQRILSSFIWDRKPSTKKVLLAQEELWVYGAMCDVVARVNKTATGPHNAAIARVDELLVGYPAAEDNPGGVNGGRVTRVGATAAGPSPTMPPPDAMAPGAPGAAAGRPPNPRFADGQRGGGGAPPASMAPEEGGAAADPDDPLRNWIYVDFTGKPLDAAQLAAATDCQMVHLMPFVLRVAIDERQIDALLVALATAPVPIDVRQVRFGQTASAQGAAQPNPSGGAPSGAGRLYDVNLELRGTVGLAAPPNEKTVGLEPGQGDEAAPAEAGEKPPAGSKAALLDRPAVRRIAS